MIEELIGELAFSDLGPTDQDGRPLSLVGNEPCEELGLLSHRAPGGASVAAAEIHSH